VSLSFAVPAKLHRRAPRPPTRAKAGRLRRYLAAARKAVAVGTATAVAAAGMVALTPEPGQAAGGIVIPRGEIRLHADPNHRPFPEYSATLSRKIVSRINPNDVSDAKDVAMVVTGAACLLTAEGGPGAVVACEVVAALSHIHVARELRTSIEQKSCFRVRVLQVSQFPAQFVAHANAEKRLPFCIPSEGAVDTPRPLPLDPPRPVAGPPAPSAPNIPRGPGRAVPPPPPPAPVRAFSWLGQSITAIDGSPVDQLRLVPGAKYVMTVDTRLAGNAAYPSKDLYLAIPGLKGRPAFADGSWPADNVPATSGTTAVLQPGSRATYRGVITGPPAGKSYKVYLTPYLGSTPLRGPEVWLLFGSRPDPVLTTPPQGGSSAACPPAALCSMPSGGTLQRPSDQPAEQPAPPPPSSAPPAAPAPEQDLTTRCYGTGQAGGLELEKDVIMAAGPNYTSDRCDAISLKLTSAAYPTYARACLETSDGSSITSCGAWVFLSYAATWDRLMPGVPAGSRWQLQMRAEGDQSARFMLTR